MVLLHSEEGLAVDLVSRLLLDKVWEVEWDRPEDRLRSVVQMQALAAAAVVRVLVHWLVGHRHLHLDLRRLPVVLAQAARLVVAEEQHSGHQLRLALHEDRTIAHEV